MDPETLAKVKTEVNAVTNLAGNIAGMFVPGHAAYIVLGKAFAALAPEVYQDCVEIFEKKSESQEDRDALAVDIHTLLNPETA